MGIEILGGEQDWGTCEIPKDSIKNCVIKGLERWLRALPAFPKVLSSIPSNHMVAQNHL